MVCIYKSEKTESGSDDVFWAFKELMIPVAIINWLLVYIAFFFFLTVH